MPERSPSPPIRLNLGCGPHPVPGWLNADRQPADGVDLCGDIRAGLALADDAVDCVVAIHFLQDLAWDAIDPALREMRRVLRPGGMLRLAVPDLDRAIDAYRRGEGGYFFVPDADARSVGAKLVTQIIWYGSVRTPFTWDFAHEWLQGAGFREVARCAYRETRHGDAAIIALDNRERESLFIEALK
ncbi:MAG TPA: methyltransferase domain-containing protein [Caldimonas sp.]|nr:methyltransferase domain-containing protein [Caldimonas sp.]